MVTSSKSSDFGKKVQFSCLIVHVCLLVRVHNFIWKRKECHACHYTSFNFSSSFDHLEGGLGDFPYQESTRILHPLPRPPIPFLECFSCGKISQPGLVYKLYWEISSHAVSHVTSGRQSAVTQGALIVTIYIYRGKTLFSE